FAIKLAPHFESVVAIDTSQSMIELAAAVQPTKSNVRFRVLDFWDAELENDRFDFVSFIAVIHHMPLAKTLERVRDLLNPGGQLAIVGCYKEQSIEDYFYSALAAPVNLAYCWYNGGYDSVSAPTSPATQTLKEIVARATETLPGAKITRLLFWRYLLLYTKPELPNKAQNRF
ncbi:unnamed protein product, partial [marine sediment metagenome]